MSKVATKFLDYEGVRKLLEEQDLKNEKRFAKSVDDKKAIPIGAIHGLFAETIEGGISYNGVLGDFTIKGLTTTESLMIAENALTISADAPISEMHVVGFESATIQAGDQLYTLSNVDSDTSNGLELVAVN